MFRRFLILAIAFALVPITISAAESDLGISPSDIRFSTETLVSGAEIRIYAAIKNFGNEDTSGYVYFYQGTQPIGVSQIVSTVAGGEKDEVWVDFSVPYGAFNIKAEIKGQDPDDTNPSNDVAITSLFNPIVDEDRDGIEDSEDNCPEDANTDQADTDKDGAGDVCDDDDDNDGLTDDVEQELGTDPKDTDTDGDGVSDADDSAPLDPNQQSLETTTS
ncbi:thrombospondin type 3 repeat-containing protein, partial [Patescibacteria group bacterium]|nr:thrombospondin type 3 repeat-containing protein [Patescibacteria group bacterium]